MKYKNKVFIDENGKRWDSKKEYKYYLTLKDRGIENIETQVKFELIPKVGKQRAINYIADFVYIDNEGEHVVDVKSPATAKDKVFVLKKKLFFWKYGKEIEIIL